MGVGYYLTEDVVRDAKGKLLSDGTWTYKPPTIDTIPQKFNVELYNSPAHKDRIFSSKGFAHKTVKSISQIFKTFNHSLECSNSFMN